MSIALGRSLPFHLTTEPATKFEPFTDKVKSCPPVGAQVGSSPVIVGTGLLPPVTVNFTALDGPPPGAGLITVTVTVPAEVTAEAGMAAVNCVALTNVVTGVVPPNSTSEAATKFVPLIVSVKAEPPAVELLGEIEVMVGVGLDPLGG